MKKGFTLVELSIVLVIIGLLIGGILVGQSLITTAKINKLVSRLQQYQIAVVQFKTVYKYYPGDSPAFIPPGNGDGIICCTGITDTTSCAAPPYDAYSAYEVFQVWAHLSQAGMLSENYASYSPTDCGGPHAGFTFDSWLAHNDNAAEPSIKLNRTVMGGDSGIRFTTTNNTPSFAFFLDAEYVIPVEHKLSPAIVDTYGAGMCLPAYEQEDDIISCTDPTALYSFLYYKFNSIF